MLSEGQAVLRLNLVHPFLFTSSLTANGSEEETFSPFEAGLPHKATVCDIIAQRGELQKIVDVLINYFAQCAAANGLPESRDGAVLQQWPGSYFQEEMAELRASSKASWEHFSQRGCRSMVPELQGTVDEQVVFIASTGFLHLLGVRHFVLDHPDFENLESHLWYGVWFVQWVLNLHHDLHKHANMRLGSDEELDPEATPVNMTFRCTACGKKCKLEFNGDITLNGEIHDECTPGGNVVQDELSGVASAENGDGEEAGGGEVGGVGGCGSGGGGGGGGGREGVGRSGKVRRKNPKAPKQPEVLPIFSTRRGAIYRALATMGKAHPSTIAKKANLMFSSVPAATAATAATVLPTTTNTPTTPAISTATNNNPPGRRRKDDDEEYVPTGGGGRARENGARGDGGEFVGEITKEEVMCAIDEIKRKTPEGRTAEEQDVFDQREGSGIKLRSVAAWSEGAISVHAFDSTTNGVIILFITVPISETPASPGGR